MSYTNNILVQAYLQRDLEDEEIVFLSVLLPAVDKWINDKTGSRFDEVAATTRYYDGGNYSIDIDPVTDITSITSVTDERVVDYTYTVNTEYLLYPENETVKTEIRRRYGTFPRGVSRIAVTGKFSEYDDGVPQDIEIAATAIAADVLEASKNAKTANVESESIEGYSVKYRSVNETVNKVALEDPLIKSILDMRRQIMLG